MLVSSYALWGEEPTPEKPATYTAYLMDALPDKPSPKRPAVVVLGGGSFEYIAPHEQEPVALAFLNAGYQAFVLNYVTNQSGDVSFPNPEVDAAKMVATVRARATEWNVDPQKVVVVGFSAGGFIAASLAAQWKKGSFAALAGERPDAIRPDAVVLGYPLLDLRVTRDKELKDPRIDLRVPKTGGKTGRDLLNERLALIAGAEATEERLCDICPTTHVGHQMPPVFAWAAADDKTCPVSQLYSFGAVLAEEQVPSEIHVFDAGGHGLSLANKNTAVDNEDQQASVRPWISLALSFLERHL